MNQEDRIFTDSSRTKDMLWNSYYGFTEWFSVYLAEQQTLGGKVGRDVRAGLYRYAWNFYYEIIPIVDRFKTKFKKGEVEKLKDLFKDPNKHLQVNDWVFIRQFFSEFMTQSGVKNVVVSAYQGSIIDKEIDAL